MTTASLTKDFIEFMGEIGLKEENLYISDGDQDFDTVGFVDSDDSGNNYDVTVMIQKDSDGFVVFVTRELKKYNEVNVLKFINELNKYYVNGSFYCDKGGKKLILRDSLTGIQGDVDTLTASISNIIERMKEQSVKIDS